LNKLLLFQELVIYSLGAPRCTF